MREWNLKKTWRASWVAALSLLVAVLAGLVITACNSTEPGDPTFEIKGDSAWLSLDSLSIERVNSDGEVIDVLFAGKLNSMNELKNLPAGDFDGKTAIIVVKGFNAGEQVLGITSTFDGESKTTDNDVIQDHSKAPEAVRFSTDSVLVDAGDEVIAYVRIEPLAAKQDLVFNSSGEEFTYTTTAVADSGLRLRIRTQSAGEALLIAKAAKDDGKNDTLRLRILSTDADSLVIEKDSLWVDVGEETIVTGKILPVKATQAMTWLVRNTRLATLSLTDSNGASVRVKGRRTGTTWLIAVAKADSAVRDSIPLQITGENPPPPSVQGFGPDTVISIRDSVAFTATLAAGNGALQSWSIDFEEDGRIDASDDLEGTTYNWKLGRVFASEGNYVLRLEVANDQGETAFDTVRVEVLRDVPVAAAGGDSVSKMGLEVSFNGEASQRFGTIVMWKWDFNGDGTWDDSSATKKTFTHKYTAEGEYTAKLLVRDDDGNEATSTRTIDIGNAPPLITSFRPDTTITIKDSVTFRASLTDPDGTLDSVKIDFDGDGNTDVTSTPNAAEYTLNVGHRFAEVGVFNVVLTAVDDLGRTVTDSVRVQVDLDAPSAEAGQDTTVHVGTTVNLRGYATDGRGQVAERAWKIGSGAYTVLSKNDTSFTAPTTAQALKCVFKVTDDDGNVVEDTVTVNVIYRSNAHLQTLFVQGATIDPVFNTNTLDYTAQVESSVGSLTISGTVTDAAATLKINGVATASAASRIVNLSAGTNVIPIEVTAQNGTTVRTYRITVFRGFDANANLTNLVLSHGALDSAFRTSDTSYAVILPDTVASLTLTPTAAAASSVIRLNGTTVVASGSPTAALAMAVGKTTVTLVVTAQDGTTKKTYTFDFYRGAWRQLGGIIGGTTANQTSIVANGNELWVVYIDTVAGSRIKAKRYVNNAWSAATNISDSIGRGFDVYAENGNLWIAYTQGLLTYRLHVKRWNGSTWTTWFNLNSTNTYPPSITAAGGVPYVAYSSLVGSTYKSSVKYLSGALWQVIDTLGAGSDTLTYYSRIVPYSTNGIVLLNQEYDYAGGAYKLSAKRWITGASVFTNYGKYVTPGSTTGLSAISVGSIPYVAFVDGTNSNRFSVKRYSSSTNWPNQGDPGFSTVGSSGYYTSIHHTGSEFLVAGAAGTNASGGYNLHCYKFDGIEWLPVGGKHLTARTNSTTAIPRKMLTTIGKNTYVVFSDYTQTNQVVVYEHYDPTP